MTIDEAIRILDKKTSANALREYDEIIRYTVVEEACKIACEIMRDHQVTEKAYQMAIDDDIKVTMENKRLKEEIERLRTERGEIENVE